MPYLISKLLSILRKDMAKKDVKRLLFKYFTCSSVHTFFIKKEEKKRKELLKYIILAQLKSWNLTCFFTPPPPG